MGLVKTDAWLTGKSCKPSFLFIAFKSAHHFLVHSLGQIQIHIHFFVIKLIFLNKWNVLLVSLRWVPDVCELMRARSCSENVTSAYQDFSLSQHTLSFHISARMPFYCLASCFVHLWTLTETDVILASLTENQQFSPLCRFYNGYQELRVVVTGWQIEGHRKWSTTEVSFQVQQTPVNILKVHEKCWVLAVLCSLREIGNHWSEGFKTSKI